jgi:hypothetical protein
MSKIDFDKIEIDYNYYDLNTTVEYAINGEKELVYFGVSEYNKNLDETVEIFLGFTLDEAQQLALKLLGIVDEIQNTWTKELINESRSEK